MFEVGQEVFVWQSGSPCKIVEVHEDGYYTCLFNEGSTMHKEVTDKVHGRELIADESKDTVTRKIYELLGTPPDIIEKLMED